MNAVNSENKEVVTTGDNGVTDNNNTLVAEDPGNKKDINSAGTAEPAAENSIPPESGVNKEKISVPAEGGENKEKNSVPAESGENEEEEEMGIDQLKRKISFVLQRFDPYYGEKEEYDLFLPDGSKKSIMVNDTTTVWDLTERLDQWVGPRMLYVGLRSRKARKNARGEYEFTDRTITRESTMPWTMKEVHEEHKWVLVVCFRSEKEWRDVTEPWAGLLNRPSGAGRR